MKLYCAIDLHSNNAVLVIIDENDLTVFQKRLPNELEAILLALSPYKDQITAIAIESTYNWYWLVDGLMEAGYDVKLVNTAKVPLYSGLKYSNDESDAYHLAHLMRLGVLPTGYIYPKAERSVRDLLRKRMQLVHIRTQQILSIQTQYTRNTGKSVSGDEVKRAQEPLLDSFDPNIKMAIGANHALLECASEHISEIEKRVLRQCKLRPEFKVLLSVDGIGEILGMTVMLETGDINRFEKVGQYASYCRCVGSQRTSNGKKKGSGNTKNGNKYLSWAYVEAANYAKRYNRLAERFYQRKAAKRNNVVAIKALAHKLARACYYIMRDQKPFDETMLFA
jgi:transposase